MWASSHSAISTSHTDVSTPHHRNGCAHHGIALKIIIRAPDLARCASREAHVLPQHGSGAFNISSLQPIQLVSFLLLVFYSRHLRQYSEEGSTAQKRLRSLIKKTDLKNKLIIRAE